MIPEKPEEILQNLANAITDALESNVLTDDIRSNLADFSLETMNILARGGELEDTWMRQHFANAVIRATEKKARKKPPFNFRDVYTLPHKMYPPESEYLSRGFWDYEEREVFVDHVVVPLMNSGSLEILAN